MHQLVQMEDSAGVRQALTGLSHQMAGYNLRVFIGPISRELSEAEVVGVCVCPAVATFRLRECRPARSRRISPLPIVFRSSFLSFHFLILGCNMLQHCIWCLGQLLPLQTLR